MNGYIATPGFATIAITSAVFCSITATRSG
jgi:hypothetical protein